MRKTLTMLAATSALGLAGCGTTQIHPEVLGNKIDRLIDNTISNAPYIAGQVIARTNPNITPQQAVALDAVSTAGMQSNIAQESRPNVYVNLNREASTDYDIRADSHYKVMSITTVPQPKGSLYVFINDLTHEQKQVFYPEGK